VKKGYLVFLMLLLSAPVALGHRLNEYLEATTISLAPGKVMLELRLTPGVAIAAMVLKDIDLNSDNLISTGEQDAYLARLNKDVLLTLDGRNTGLKIVSFTFPAVETIRKGTGDIIIEFEADLEQKNVLHRLQLKNNHYNTIAVYLVNCLLPANTGIHVTGQTRNTNQSVYQLDFTTAYVKPVISVQNQQQTLDKEEHWAIVKTYFVHGIRHILTGYDHLLFLCALVLGVAGFWDLVKIVTAFTIAHSITLTLATFGYAHLPEQIVEPVIAASIVFVAVQNIWWPKKANGNSRLAIAFIFGLFHGLGFAGGLLELMHGMPVNTIWYAILGFSLGVEAGNQLVIIPLYTVLQVYKLKESKTATLLKRAPKLRQYASGIVAIAGLCYLVSDLV
jgi:hydrogenase/urease accessory protein HupE